MPAYFSWRDFFPDRNCGRSPDSLPAYRTGSHHSNRTKRHFADRNITTGHHEIVEGFIAITAIGDGIAPREVNVPDREPFMEKTERRMFIHRPSTICDGIFKNPVAADIGFPQHIIPNQTTAFTDSRDCSDPGECIIRSSMIPTVLYVVPDAVNAFPEFLGNFF